MILKEAKIFKSEVIDMEIWQLKQLQGLPLEVKIEKTKLRIREWYEHWEGKVYVSFSGGKDSTVLLHLVRSMYPDVQAVFADTGLEYPEIREFVKTIDNVVWLKPKKRFDEVIKENGYPVISKQVSRFVSDLKVSGDGNALTKKLRLTGVNSKGVNCPSQKLSNKWMYLIDAPFKVSDRCCHYMKKEPMYRYSKETEKKGITGTMASESGARSKEWLKNGCNSFDLEHPLSNPISFWTETDIWEYIKRFNVAYSKIYDMGEKRTGCMFCMFGIQYDDEENRFMRMKKTHPKQWDYCINKLGCGRVLDYINIPYEEQQISMFDEKEEQPHENQI